ncbi:MAG: hypothetical protein CMG74_11550 [Candidatus Marinimicrobia bacterium]|nr:hypothetical protein [Candidatus Neomarinimicrobiota bacterium]|tara:strand:- start:2322 stop:3929 length:1608 start_codon:yes stop_codon:yes gene_type:complete
MTKLQALFLGISIFYLSCFSLGKEKPKLVVLMVADQMRPDHLTRFDSLYNGGLRWLIDNGINFNNSHHEHSNTLTGPGYFTIGTGKYPGSQGIWGNDYYDREIEKTVNCVEDFNADPIGGDGKARSYSRHNSTGIGDWLKAANPISKVYSIAGKDRAAVFLGGKNPDLVLYYNYKGQFITSNYYTDQAPNWLEKFNLIQNISTYKDSIWRRSFSDSLYLKYSREDNFSGEKDTYQRFPYSPVFPIGFDSEIDPNSQIMGRPWFERIILNLGLKIILEESLGMDNKPDILCISFSAMDWMIHDYGPFSQEVMDACIKLDKYIGVFINELDKLIGLEHIEFIFTSDHGGLPLPEFQQKNGIQAGRINPDELLEAYEWIEDEITEEYDKDLFVRDGINYYFDLETLKKRNIPLSKLQNIVKKYLPKVVGIEKVFTKKDILEGDSTDKIIYRLQNMVHKEKSPDAISIVSPGYLFRNPHGTSHGSPYDYDTHVPLLFSKKGRKKKSVLDATETVDIAPTIARILGINHLAKYDGKPLDF